MNRLNRKVHAAFALIGVLSASSAFAAGFEKSQLWSASAVSQGGAVVGSVGGAEALYFNPAGLAQSNGIEISGNFSPTWSKFSGANPYQNSGTTGNPGSVDGESGFSPIGALLISHKMTEQLGVGIGYYVSGGNKSKYEGLSYTHVSAGLPYTMTPLVETNLAIREAALGASYEVMPGLRFGAAWRVVMVDADFSTVVAPTGNPNAAIANATVSDISKTRWNGYKLGLQYEAADKAWGAGMAYRSGVNFTAEGDYNATLETAAGAPTPLTADKARVSNSFPQQFNVGGYMKATEALRTSVEYSFTNYSKNKVLPIETSSATTIIRQDWKNQHVGRLGFEYTGMSMPIRLGYAYTSQVTPSDRARSTFASPGSGHAIAAGSGLALGPVDFDYAFEYSFASGKGTNAPEVPAEQEFKSHAYAAHLSAKMKF